MLQTPRDIRPSVRHGSSGPKPLACKLGRSLLKQKRCPHATPLRSRNVWAQREPSRTILIRKSFKGTGGKTLKTERKSLKGQILLQHEGLRKQHTIPERVTGSQRLAILSTPKYPFLDMHTLDNRTAQYITRLALPFHALWAVDRKGKMRDPEEKRNRKKD
jgi:hypothetical protein